MKMKNVHWQRDQFRRQYFRVNTFNCKIIPTIKAFKNTFQSFSLPDSDRLSCQQWWILPLLRYYSEIIFEWIQELLLLVSYFSFLQIQVCPLLVEDSWKLPLMRNVRTHGVETERHLTLYMKINTTSIVQNYIQNFVISRDLRI